MDTRSQQGANNWTPSLGEEVWIEGIIGRRGRPVVLMGKVLEVSPDIVKVELFHQLNLPVVFEKTVPRNKITPVEE